MLDIENLESLLKSVTPIALAAAWVWTQIRTADKEEHDQKLSIGDREMQYAERLEKRLEKAQEELEEALKSLNAKESVEEVLKAVVAADPGVMFIKKYVGPKKYEILKVSQGYQVLYLGGPSENIEGRNEEILGEDYSKNDEIVYTTQRGMMVREDVYSPLTGIRGTFVGRKFPVVFGHSTYIVGIGEHEFDKKT